MINDLIQQLIHNTINIKKVLIPKYFDKKSIGNSADMQADITDAAIIKSNQQLADKLYKPIITKSQKQKVHSSFMDDWGHIGD